MTIKKLGILFGCVAGLALMAGAAYLAVWLVTSGAAQAGRASRSGPGSGPQTSFSSRGGPVKSAEIKLSPELPATPHDAAGAILAVKDHVLTIAGEAGIGLSQDGSQPQGPRTEIVLTASTKVYRDTTFDQMKAPPEDGAVIQQTVARLPAPHFAPGDQVTVWGQRRGDRLVAEVVLLAPQNIGLER